jgi:hypothetical protein
MGINSLKNRYERHCDSQEKTRKAIVETLDELKKQCGYIEFLDSPLSLGFFMKVSGAPPISVAERLGAIEKYLGIEIVREAARVVVKKRAKKSKGA